MKLKTKAKKAYHLLREGNLKEFSVKFDYYFNNKLNVFAVPSAVARISDIKKEFQKTSDTGWLFDAVFPVKVMRPTQIRSEISRLLEILKGKNIKNVLEIGTANGGTIFFFSQVAEDDARLVTVDMKNRLFGYGYPAWRNAIYRSFPKDKQSLRLIKGDSHTAETLRDVHAALKGDNVDFLFIDGDHSYEGVKKDFEMYGPLVKAGGIIAFHDIVEGPEEFVGGAPRFWKEIKGKYRHEELVNDWGQGGLGIGVLYT